MKNLQAVIRRIGFKLSWMMMRRTPPVKARSYSPKNAKHLYSKDGKNMSL